MFPKGLSDSDAFPLDHPTSAGMLSPPPSTWGGLFSYDFLREDSLDFYPELDLSHPVLCLQINSNIYICEHHSMRTHVWGLSHLPFNSKKTLF